MMFTPAHMRPNIHLSLIIKVRSSKNPGEEKRVHCLHEPPSKH